MTRAPTTEGDPAARKTAPSLARSTALMSAGTIVSRVTGVLRLSVIVGVLGIAETRLTDTYNLANTVPNIIYELVLGGVIGAVFVPLFVELIEKEERERAWQVMSAIFNLSLLILTGIAALGIVAAPWIAEFYASRLGGDVGVIQERAITLLLRLFIPQVVLYGIYFIVAALLNAHKRFGAPMFTPILNNLVLIGIFIVFANTYGSVTLGTVTTTQLVVIGVGTTLSVAPMGLALLPLLRGLGRYRPTLALDHPSVRKLAKMSIFVIGFVVANQLGYIVIQWLANAQRGGYTAYVAAFTFFLLPIGLFVWSLTTALLPTLSEHAVNSRWDEYCERLTTGMRATVFLMLPASIGYLVLAEPVVRVMLQHGVVTAASTELVASVLRFLTLGLLQFSLFQLLVRASYALQDTKTPFAINCGVIALNTAINVPMFAWLGVEGLAAGQAIAYTVGAAVHVRTLRRRVPGFTAAGFVRGSVRTIVAAGGMGVLVWVTWQLAGRVAGSSLAPTIAALSATVAIGLASYLGLAKLLRVEELAFVSGLLRRGPAVPAGTASTA